MGACFRCSVLLSATSRFALLLLWREGKTAGLLKCGPNPGPSSGVPKTSLSEFIECGSIGKSMKRYHISQENVLSYTIYDELKSCLSAVLAAWVAFRHERYELYLPLHDHTPHLYHQKYLFHHTPSPPLRAPAKPSRTTSHQPRPLYRPFVGLPRHYATCQGLSTKSST